MPGSILGTRVRRVEDPALITGASTFVGNLRREGLLHAAFVRSPLAHGRITGIDTAAAASAPGVVAVFTAGDLALPAHHGSMVLNPQVSRPPLATDRVRFAGEAVASVVAESKAAAWGTSTCPPAVNPGPTTRTSMYRGRCDVCHDKGALLCD